MQRSPAAPSILALAAGATLQNVRVRYAVFGIPAGHAVTKIILDPNEAPRNGG